METPSRRKSVKRSVVKNAEKGQFKPGPFGHPEGRPKRLTFADEVQEFLREQNAEGIERLRSLLEQLCADDPKAALQFLASYAFGKPVDRVDVSGTIAGVPDEFLQLFRQDAKGL